MFVHVSSSDGRTTCTRPWQYSTASHSTKAGMMEIGREQWATGVSAPEHNSTIDPDLHLSSYHKGLVPWSGKSITWVWPCTTTSTISLSANRRATRHPQGRK